MESPGEHLKRERGLRGVELQKIFEATRAPLRYLSAIEADDYDGLPHPTFVKGYIRAYCKYLGIDDNDAVLRYEMYMREKAAGAHEQASEPESCRSDKATPLLGDKKAVYALAVVGALIIIGVYAFVVRRGGLPSAPAPKVTAQAEQPVQPASAPAREDLTAQAAKQLPAPSVNTPSQPVQGKALKPAKESEKDKPALAAKKHQLTVKATQDVWIKIRMDEADPALDVLLKHGETITWRAANTFSMIIGNAGGVSMTLDGADLGVMGRPGEVLSLVLPRTQVSPTLDNKAAPVRQKSVGVSTPLVKDGEAPARQ
ncbi:MAG: helix-turn-helix domain-containing protein [Deltaproteobacteria bacterium]|nr:helix-turn-helix domain-containing protein [Deltaproteobacteria bacterium]